MTTELSATTRAILGLLNHGFWTPGRLMRELLNADVPWWKFWRRWSGPAFYQKMARLEDAGLVEGVSTRFVTDGEYVVRRHYRLATGVTPPTEK